MSNYVTNQMIYPATQQSYADEGRGLLLRLLNPAIRNWKRRKMIATLEALDDRILRDIGIYRKDIRRVVDGFDDRELSMAPFGPAEKPANAAHDTHLKAA